MTLEILSSIACCYLFVMIGLVLFVTNPQTKSAVDQT
jgi:hypothetical protein